MIEEKPSDICYYNDYFYSKPHSNYIGLNTQEGPVVVSVAEEPLDENALTPTASFTSDKQKFIYRALIWSRHGEEQVMVEVETDLGSRIKAFTSLPLSSTSKRVLKAVQAAKTDLLSDTRFKLAKPADEFSNELLEMELRQVVSRYKFGVLYAKEGQVKETEMFSNVEGSMEFEEFLTLLGDKIQLQGWKEYRGGLNVVDNSTGTHSVYTNWRNYEIMFHVSTYLPYSSADSQQLERKRHLGNDIVVIIFYDGYTSYAPNTITSEFNHVFIVIQPVRTATGLCYRMGVVTKEGVPPFQPFIPDPHQYLFPHTPAFREFLLTKLINAERGAYEAPAFATKIKRTRKMLLEELHSNFGK